MDSQAVLEFLARSAVIVFVASLIQAYRIRRENRLIEFEKIQSEDNQNNPEEMLYYQSRGYDQDSAFYEARQAQSDNDPQPWSGSDLWEAWIPGLDRSFAATFESNNYEQVRTKSWLSIFDLECGCHHPSKNSFRKTPEMIYCFICRKVNPVLRVIKRSDEFPNESDINQMIQTWNNAKK
jgi:hypothetical protein